MKNITLKIPVTFIKDNLRLLLISISLLCYALFAVNNNDNFTILSFGIICSLLIMGTDSENFYIITSLAIFEHMAIIGNISILFVYFFIASIKLLINKTGYNYSKLLAIFASLLIIVIEFSFDFMNIKIGEFINWFSGFTYFIIFVCNYNFKKYNHKYTIKYFIIAYVMAIFGTILASGGSVETFIQQTSNNEVMRLGDEVRSLGGAMGIPLYTVIVIALLFAYVLKDNLKFTQKMGLYLLMACAGLIGFLSVSRIYLIDLMVIVLVLILSLPTKKFSRIFKVLVLFAGIIFLVIYKNPSMIDNITGSYITRMNISDLSTGRYEIWESCINYLKDNPVVLFFGLGAKNYVQLGFREGYMFSMMAHNIYLDAIMSWGIIGTLSLAIIIRYFYLKCRNYYGGKINLISLMPLIVVMVHYMTSGTFNYIRNFTYILIFILHIFISGKHEQTEYQNLPGSEGLHNG